VLLKVLQLVASVEDGFEVGAIRPLRRGGMRIELARGEARRVMVFAHYEVPAVVCEVVELGAAK
jgi:hypothetical protein